MNFNHKVLFQSEIPRAQFMGYLQRFTEIQTIEQITVEMKNASRMLSSMIDLDSYEENIFFKNYETLISIIYESNHDVASNLALHRLNLYAQRLIEAKNPKEAKNLLENTFSYLHQSNVDSLLLSTALNNLSFLYFLQKDYQLSLNTTFQNIIFCQQSIKELQSVKRSKKIKAKIQSLSIILINSLKLTKQIINVCQKNYLFGVLSTLKMFQSQSQFFDLEKLKKAINKLGYDACIQYLGQQSYFSQFFQRDERKQKSFKDIQVQTQSQESIYFVNRNQFNLFQSQTLNKLGNIHKMLESNEHHKNFVKVKGKQEDKIFLSTKNSEQYIQDQHQKYEMKFSQKTHFHESEKYQNQQDIFCNQQLLNHQIFKFNQWQISIKHFKSPQQNVGNLQFKWKNIKDDMQFFQVIKQKQLMKILSLRCLEDTMPYQYSLKNLPQNFIDVCIKTFLSISQNGQLIHLIRANTLTHEPIISKFLSCKCLIFFFHIRANIFRIAISPTDESGSIYLNVQFCQNTLNEFFNELIDITPQKIQYLFENQLKKFNKKAKNTFNNIKSIIVKDFSKLKTKIISILKGFEIFLGNQEDSTQGNDIFGWIQKDQYLWKFVDNRQQNMGSFLRIKFIKHCKAFNIYGQQYDFQKQQSNIINRKGSFQFRSHQFRQVFGFQPQYDMIKDKIKRIEEILSYKYVFKQNHDQSNFCLINQNSQSNLRDINCMVERSFNQQSFCVDFISDQENPNYLCLITASVVTLSNIFPIGIKISLYDPFYVINKAFFINIFSQDWSYESLSQQKEKIFNCQHVQFLNKKQVMFKTLVEKYPEEQNYFLTSWLKTSGFKRILSKVLNEKSSLYLQKNLNSIINWSSIFQE